MMRMGVLTTLGYERPDNLVHILLDNEVHESTGKQSTVSHSIDLGWIAATCGYPSVTKTTVAEEIGRILDANDPGLKFIHLKTAPGVPDNLPRPSITPEDVAKRLIQHITGAKQ